MFLKKLLNLLRSLKALVVIYKLMIVENLISEFDELLVNADEIWFAVALIKDETYDYIQESLSEHCKQHYLVGIDLPTNPSVLRKMKEKLIEGFFDSSIYKTDANYHPKVYLFRVKDSYTAFVGSSNLTDGGLEDNVELNYKITNQEECFSILKWFNELNKDTYPLTEENIKEYEDQFSSIKEIEGNLKNRKRLIKLRKPNRDAPANNPLDAIDFSDRYFKKEHHLAFRRELWTKDDFDSIAERETAKNRFIELHNSIYPHFRDYGLEILQPNPMPDHLISMIRQIDPSKPRPLDAIWLSYGKSIDEIKEYQKKVGNDQKAKQTFIHHARLQIRVDIAKIGIWLLFAKENEGGLFDRTFFKEKMLNQDYRDRFYQMIKSLPNEYFFIVNDKVEMCYNFKSADELHRFCRKDNIQKYFIIGRDYKITDHEMSEDNLPTETLKVFNLLYPFYDIMKHRF